MTKLAKWQEAYIRKLQKMSSRDLLNETLWMHSDYRDEDIFRPRKDWKFSECERQLLGRCYDSELE